ncbi:MAG: TAT-variant-translocated molybdopterin oxidoreductase [Bacteroidetes bacterium]|nr:TAT-variant-translocated molybdopterin oxidoreductase [Bacteroidota bacterium]
MENNRRYFKGLEELNTSAPKSKEFLPSTPGKNVIDEGEFDLKSSRRDFLKFMGFSVSAATLAACTKTPVKKAIPYITKPAEVDPGVPNYYATYYPAGDFGVVVKTREGRPIKVDGNKLCPVSNGGSSANAQASVLSLYDDKRLQGPAKNGNPTDWKTIDKELYKGLDGISKAGGQIAILSGTVNSPSTLRAISKFKATHANTRHIQYDAVSYNGLREAHNRVFGKNVTPNYYFEKADTIVSFGADFLGTWLSPVRFSGGYAVNRDVTVNNHMSYHVQFEGSLSLAGSKADLRVPTAPSEYGAKLVELYNVLSGNGSSSDEKINHVADELKKSKGKSIVVCGHNSIDHQVVVAEINKLLNNYGNTIDIEQPLKTKQGNDKEVQQLIAEMNAGNISALIVYGTNPVYSHPSSAEFAAGLSKVELTVSLNDRMDETTKLCTYACPDSHYLESWNDYNPIGNVFHLSQPCIQTIFDTRQAQESILTWGQAKTDYYDFIQETWSKDVSRYQLGFSSFKKFWNQSLHDGVFVGKGSAVSSGLALATAVAGATTSTGEDVVLTSTSTDSTTITEINSTTSHERVGIRQAAREVVHGENSVRGAVRDIIHGRENTEIEISESTQVSENTSSDTLSATTAGAAGIASHYSSNASGALSGAISNISNGGSGFELELYQKTGIMDGADGYNPWLLELPDAVSKVSWDNYVCVSPTYATEQGWADGDLVKISANGKTLENVPVLVMPGQKNGVFSLALGYGKAKQEGADLDVVGVNAYPLVKAGDTLGYSISGVSIEKTGSGYQLAKTQTHHHIQIPEGFVAKDQKSKARRKADIIKEMELEGGLVAYRNTHGHDEHGHNGHDAHGEEAHGGGHHSADNGKAYDSDEPKKYEDLSLYPSWTDRNYYKAIHWGLTVNLNTCTGCNACVIACQAENNIPVVGKKEVLNRREMHWIRIDRYFASEDGKEEKDPILNTENPTVSFQPLMCQHCDNAPCENVCPVNAVNHSSEGLNQMIYNRCMGTRYCANNCPYKVRRFNWFAYYDNDKFNFNMNNEYGRMVLNPDVTVRARGVMEKCTFCVQRIQGAKLTAKAENRALVDGDVRTACQDACPTGAITFGDMNNKESKVSKIIEGDLSYRIVELLNTDNSVYYTTLVRNTKLKSKETAHAETHAEDTH